VEVIQRFFNHFWQFMDAYQHGLTGKAADWAVWKQKAHRQVRQAAMMSIEAVINQETPHKGHIKVEILPQKIVPTKNSWEKSSKVGFGRFQPF
jgi:hypothetical protein